jgi:Mrp family chromosome partitioning ATPase
MSKIFDAYKKKAGEGLDLSLELSRSGAIALYPQPVGPQQDDFNRLANRLLDLRGGSRGTVLGFASSASGEGNSFVSYNAALYLASNYNQKVVWIDGNFLSPQAQLREKSGPTFSSLLQDPSVAGTLVAESNPHLIGSGSNLIGVKGLFADGKYQQLLANLANRFDFVILDLPPVLANADSSLMAAACDGMLLVIEQKFLKWEIIEHGIEDLKDKGVQVLGSVINRREFALPKVIYDRL